MKDSTKYKVNGLVLLCSCTDGRFREVSLSPAALVRVHRTLKHVSGGTIKLYSNTVRVVHHEIWIVRFLRSLGRCRTKQTAAIS
jgi:hypothetical protein